jgi:hypothetical protein
MLLTNNRSRQKKMYLRKSWSFQLSIYKFTAGYLDLSFWDTADTRSDWEHVTRSCTRGVKTVQLLIYLARLEQQSLAD